MTKVRRMLITPLIAVGLVLLCTSPAVAHRGRVFGRLFGAPGSGAGQLSLVSLTETEKSFVRVSGGSGAAVDETSHNIYIADTGNNRVDEFSPDGTFIRAWGWGVMNGAAEFQICTDVTGCKAAVSGTHPGQFDSPVFIAVDDSPGGEGDIYVADYRTEGSGNHLVQKFTANGALVESWGSKGQINEETVLDTTLESIHGVAVEPDGKLLVGTGSGLFEFDKSSGAYIERVDNKGVVAFPNGLAMDGAGNFYFGLFDEIFKYSPGDAGEMMIFRLRNKPPSGFFHPLSTGVAVSRSGELYLDEGNAIQVLASSCVAECAPIVTFTSPLLTDGAGLAVDSSREAVYIAEVASDRIESIVPEPPASPLVEAGSESVSGVSGDSATLEAVVNPRSETSEEPTSYRFQYTTEESFQRKGFADASTIPVPDGQLAPNYEADLVTARPQNLLPGTVYRYRVVAENAISRKEGIATEGERDEAGEEVARTFRTQPLGGFALSDGRAWELVSPPNKHGALIGPIAGAGLVQASARGDAFTYLASVPTGATPEGNSNSTQVLSTRGTGGTAWGTRDIATPREVANGTDLSDSTHEYRYFSGDLSLSIVNPWGAFDPSMSVEASEQTAFLRTDFPSGDPGDPCVIGCYRPLVSGAAGFANVPEGTEFGEGLCHTGNTQECGPTFAGATSDASHIVLGSKVALTEGAPEHSLYEWTSGQLALVSVLPNDEASPSGGTLGLARNAALRGVGRNAISTDGSRVVWSTSTALYLRDMVREETVQLGNASRESPGEFQTASTDDSRVFFTIPHDPRTSDLYMFEAPVGGALSAGHVTNMTPGGGVLGFVTGASQDGSSVYFVDETVMSGSEANEQGEVAIAGRPNLYVEREGTIRLVAVLSSEDGRDWVPQAHSNPEPDHLTAMVSQNGRWLAFMSERSLTRYDNRDASSGQRDEEVFLYDANASNRQGGLVCASCDPTGARPHGILVGGYGTVLADGAGLWTGRWLAGNIPGWTSPVHQSRYLSDSGRLFFNSSDALVASDTNGAEDVYEYEPPGVGDCTDAVRTFDARSEGCVDLISSGVSREESAFMDASENGDDVFFLTSAQLSKQDTDSVRDVYDARVGGGFPESQAPPACEGDACQSPVAAPNDPTPGSLTYQGPGNPVSLLTPNRLATKKTLKCAKGKKPVRGKCVKVKKKARKAKKTARTGRVGNRRGGRS